MSLVVEHLQAKKVLILVGYRKVVEQFESTFPHDSTFILAGKKFDHAKRIHLASHQTFNRRDIELSEYDLVIIDELHSRMSKIVMTLIANAITNQSTVVSFTGTPLTNSNKLITKNIDNYINTINVTQMLQQGYLAPTRFMVNKNILGDNAIDLKTSRGEYTEEAVRQVITKSSLLNSIVDLVAKESLATQHKTLVYVNFIQTAQDLYEMLEPLYDNVFILHSKLSDKEQTKTLSDYQSCDNGLIVSIRSLSLGFDSPTSDRLVFGLLTVVHSLALQILWRSSTLDPANQNKQAVVYDMLGVLKTVNQFTDFSEYSKKPPCREQCEQIADLMEKWFCIESCTGEPPVTECNGQLSYEQKQNPYLSNYTIHSGEPCKESVPIHSMTYKTTEISEGLIQKWSKCKCGLVTSYTLRTMTTKAEMIQVYDEFNTQTPTITVLYSREYKQAIALLDDPDKPRYKVMAFTSSEEMYQTATKFFNRPFQILSNISMGKLPNVSVDRELDAVLPLVNWNGNNDGLVKKLIIVKLEHILNYLSIKKGFAYYQRAKITKDNEKTVMQFLNSQNITKAKLVKYFDKLKDKHEH